MNLKTATAAQLFDAYELAKMEGDMETLLAISNELINRRGARN